MPSQSKADAIKQVDDHVSPRGCFIWNHGGNVGYQPIPGTGCAHWVAHEKGWDSGKVLVNGCEKGYLIRVADLFVLAGDQVDVWDVVVGNVWILKNETESHTGIVSKVTPARQGDEDANPTIEIEDCSSSQCDVVKDDWASYFHSGGKFYKG